MRGYISKIVNYEMKCESFINIKGIIIKNLSRFEHGNTLFSPI
jgi:hypothetical protein